MIPTQAMMRFLRLVDCHPGLSGYELSDLYGCARTSASSKNINLLARCGLIENHVLCHPHPAKRGKWIITEKGKEVLEIMTRLDQLTGECE